MADEDIRWISGTPFLFKNGKQVGIAWGARQTSDVVELPTRPDPEPTPPKRPGSSRAGIKHKVVRDNSVYVRYDWDEIHRLYTQDGLSMQEIARKLGCQYDTVAHALEERGVKLERVAGPPRKTHCKRGHDLEKHGVEKKGGGRYCRACRIGLPPVDLAS